jgi:beta-lactamase class A
MKQRFDIQTLVVYTAHLLVGVGMGWLANTYFLAPNPIAFRGAALYQSNAPYQYIDPLLACDVGSESAFPELVPLRDTLANIISTKQQAGLVTNASVYVRTLRGARWVQVNGAAQYAPASLLKVFVMMAYFKETDDTNNAAFLDKQLVFEGSTNPSTDMPGEVIPHLQNGKRYATREIIKQMIVYSDNDALNTLVDSFDSTTLHDFEEIFGDLNIPSPTTVKETSLNFMDVVHYSMVFRVLFGSTYLSRQYSEDALALLAQAQYKDGIVRGVPAGTAVAHKFGVAQDTTTTPGTTVDELHDCGIVYYPGHPYLFCVMTSGGTYADLQKTINELSGAAYGWLDTYWKTHPTTTAPVATSTAAH